MNQELSDEKMHDLFQQVVNEDNWKYPTHPFKTTDEVLADQMVSAICYFVGGAEKSKIGINGKEFTITSKGYYHYIGA